MRLRGSRCTFPMLVVTTQQVKNAKTKRVEEHQHLQEHLHQEYSSFQDNQDIENVAQRKEIEAIGRKGSRGGNQERKGTTASKTTESDGADHG